MSIHSYVRSRLYGKHSYARTEPCPGIEYLRIEIINHAYFI